MSLNRILFKILIAILIFIFSLTAYLIISKQAEPGKNLVSETKNTTQDQAIFFPAKTTTKNTLTSLGQIRASSKPDKSGNKAVIVLNAYLEYKDDDIDFYEELDKNIFKIKNLISEYFSSFTKDELAAKGEDKINQELLKRINSILVLQKIQKLYFVDYQFL
ncbi:flagellar basal body-associated FliL family protein [Treponema pectinovorum]|uniref:flagellar basal body-associated FliL family protein n=1 Tax=Treponema pectinovorum TaxID=164 RepID=UPI0011CAB816|nr:flagellar basal body-associated FliL family protein [Treponema pectinovorum]